MMFNRVLINDDHDAVVASVAQILHINGISEIKKTQYCDDAFLQIKKAELKGNAYDLIITDLSFKSDYRNATLQSGEDLIEQLRATGHKIPIIVYSMKDQLQKVRNLVKKQGINAYVCKDRNGSKELNEAIKAVSQGQLFLSPQVRKALQPKSKIEIDDFDIHLIKLLSKGLSQYEISDNFKSKNIFPNGLSTIEKRLNKLKIQFKAKNAIHLIAITKDLGLI